MNSANWQFGTAASLGVGAVVGLCGAVLRLEAGTGCTPGWSHQVPQWPLASVPLELVVWADGGGAAVFGLVRFAGQDGPTQHSLGRWDGYSWERRSPSLDLLGMRLWVADLGGGRSPVVSGWLREPIGDARARLLTWRDGAWVEDPTPPGGAIEDLAEYNDGGGPAAYAAFTDWSSGAPVGSVLRRTNGEWITLAGRANGAVRTLATHDDGAGVGLFAGGEFDAIDQRVTGGVVRWDGDRWAPLGAADIRGDICRLASLDVGTGAALFALGGWIRAGNASAGAAYRWSGADWESLGLTGAVVDARVATDADGLALFVVGDIGLAESGGCNGVARWSAAGWRCDDMRIWSGPVRSVCADPAPPGSPRVYVGGDFTTVGNPVRASRHLVGWSGGDWVRVNRETPAEITTLLNVANSATSGLAVGGRFYGLGDSFARYGAIFDGSRWTALFGLNGPPSAFAVFDDGRGAALYVAGASDALPATAYLWRWDGVTWETIGLPAGTRVRAMLAFDDGRGEALFLAGDSSPSPSGFPGVARWDGAELTALGGRVGSDSGGVVLALATFPIAGRAALIAAGGFDYANTTPARNMAAWDGLEWHAVPPGFAGAVYALARVETSAGPVLYAGGSFEPSVAQPGRRIAAWDGSAWSALRAGLGTARVHSVRALCPFDDGRGPGLFAGGLFDFAGDVEVRNLARWDGTAWTPVGGGTDGRVDALAAFDPDGVGPYHATLFVGGAFRGVEGGARPAAFLAAWTCLPEALRGDLDCDGRVTVRDIDPFVLALTRALAYRADYPDCHLSAADINEDQRIDVFDVDPFVELLAGAAP
ncbi:MAG: hypothetical protein AB7Q17_17860 [Phycisphaerae bacterium]